MADQQRWSVISAAALGALFGSRLLGLLEQELPLTILLHHFFMPGGGKTIVGGLLGGWMGVELVKRLHGIHARTGDLFAFPLCAGIAVGRLGCFFAGLSDDTYGKPTALPWGVNFGDGVSRHPTQAYEFVFLLLLAGLLQWFAKRPHANGSIFRLFMAAYLGWRLSIDLLKPQPLIAGLSVIQWACVAALTTIALTALAAAPHVQDDYGHA